MPIPHHSLAMARAAVLLTVVGCSSDPAGPALVDDALRVPLTAAIRDAERSTSFFASPEMGAVGLVDLTIAQMVAAGTHDRSRTADGVPTDDITQENYDAAAFLITYDIVTQAGLRLTGETLTILGWAGLDLNRGAAQALMSVRAGRRDEAVTPGIFGVEGATSHYYFEPEGRSWENGPGIEIALTSLTRPSSARGCRGDIPETVFCEVYAGSGRATGTFEFFAREVGPGTSNSVFQFLPTALDLPVRALRIVDTVRFAGP